MLPHYQQDTGNRQGPYNDPNSFVSDFSDSLNSLNLVKVLLHLGKTFHALSIVFTITEIQVLQFTCVYFLGILSVHYITNGTGQ